ncbi:MAG: hypothetical protein M0Z41_08495 [Peptococcaceae bacterium]|jgi:hypothetical protein|nr:hypothetical protein [Peptococcaceae bacterium]
MPIRVLDPEGRVLRSVSPAKAISWVEHGRAKWLHAEGIEPNKKVGTVILLRQVQAPPEERPLAQLYDGDGVFLGCIKPEWAGWVLEHKPCSLVGTLGPDGWPRALIAHRVAQDDPIVISELRHIEARRTVNAVVRRDALRQSITDVVSRCSTGDQVEVEVERLLRDYLGPDRKDIMLSDLRSVCRKAAALNVALDSDAADLRTKLVQLWAGSWRTGGTGPGREWIPEPGGRLEEAVAQQAHVGKSISSTDTARQDAGFFDVSNRKAKDSGEGQTRRTTNNSTAGMTQTLKGL